MKEQLEVEAVVSGFRQRTQAAMEPKLKPLWSKSRELSESALRTVSSIRRQCEVYMNRSKQDLARLADQRRLRSTSALGQMCRATISDCEKFSVSAKGAPLSRFDSSLSTLCERVKTNYNESGRLIAGAYGSENSSLRMEIESLQHVRNQVSTFRTKNQETFKSQAAVEELVASIVEHLDSIHRLKASRVQFEGEIRELNSKIETIRREVADIEGKEEIMLLDASVRELKRLRQLLLGQKMSRLRGPLLRFLSVAKNGQNAGEVVETLSSYMKAPLTSLAKESDGYPGLKAVLLALQGAIERGEVALNRKKAAKTLERIRQTFGDSLLSVQKEAKRAFETRRELLRSQSARVLQSRRGHLQLERNSLVDSRKLLENKITRIQEDAASQRSQLETRLGRIENLLNEVFRKKLPFDSKEGILKLATA